MQRIRSFIAVFAALALPLAAAETASTIPAPVKRAMDSIRGDAVEAHVKFLSHDLLEGRGPGTRGDAIARQYLASQFEALGLEPAGDGGSYFQKVSLLGIEQLADKTSVSFTKDGAPAIGPLKYRDEFVGSDETQSDSSALDSELVFVGHGVVAPEYNWDDYKGVDVRGKTLVMLVDDPPATAAEPDLFKGKARTYYGRWTYKYEMGASKGAQAVILVHTDEAAGYAWQVVRGSWGRERSYVKLTPGQPALRMSGWITQDIAKKLFAAAGQDLDAMTAAAHRRDFRPVALGYKLSGNISSRVRPFDTANVVARVPGSDAMLRNQAILYSAHHDHLGIGQPDATGDTIFNGAMDNSTGSGLLIELARAWMQASPKPKRSILFAAVAAEEQGLLGSAWYGRNPTIPAGRIGLGINLDMIYAHGRARDVTMNGVERMTFYPAAQKVTKALGLRIVPDPAPEQGSYYRSDHFSLAKVGIPAFSLELGNDVIGKPEGWGKTFDEEFRAKRYHQQSDEYEPGWDWSSLEQMGELALWLGWEAANTPEMPNWVAGDEFRAVRDASIK